MNSYQTTKRWLPWIPTQIRREENEMNCLKSLALAIAVGALLFFGSGSSVSAQLLVNGGFETGDLTGWTPTIPAGGFISVVAGGSGEVAIEGTVFAHMKTNGPGSFTTLSQSFSAGLGFEISGFAFFFDQEAAQSQPCFFADRMEVNILAPGPVLVAQVFLAEHCLGGFDGSKPWTFWSYTFDGTEPAGPYSVEARITNIGDSIVDSTSGVDGIEGNTPPVASCVEGVNPSGKKTPPAGSTTLPGSKGGKNEDGFYELVGEDNEDGTAPVFVTNASGSATFGPFSSGSVVKITEDPEETPTAKPMGGPNSAVAAHIILDSDAFVFAVDSSGGTSPVVSCLVPPPPK